MRERSAIAPNCRTCGLPINDPTSIIWNGHHYHNDHIPSREPPPVFEVVQLQLDENATGLWIGFKTDADRQRALEWFKVKDARS